MPVMFPPYPLHVVTPLGDGYVVYINDNNLWDNDEVCVALCEGGQWRHFTTDQIKSYQNLTYGITKQQHENSTNP